MQSANIDEQQYFKKKLEYLKDIATERRAKRQKAELSVRQEHIESWKVDMAILKMASQGCTALNMEKVLKISHRAIENRIGMLKKVFNCKNRVELILTAYKNNLI